MRHANRLLEQATRTLAERGESYGSPKLLFEKIFEPQEIILEKVNQQLEGLCC